MQFEPFEVQEGQRLYCFNQIKILTLIYIEIFVPLTAGAGGIVVVVDVVVFVDGTSESHPLRLLRFAGASALLLSILINLLLFVL